MTDWLNKSLQQNKKNKAAQVLIKLVGRSYKEVLLGQIGPETQKLLQYALDPDTGQLLADLALQMPEVGEALGVITKAVQEMMDGAQTMENGGELIHEWKNGGDCGCAKYKKLMRIGGKIHQITVDCNDNIVSE